MNIFSKRVNKKILAALIVLLLSALACNFGTEITEVQEEKRTIPMEDIANLNVELRMGAGELRLGGVTDQLLDATFTYSPDDWQPSLVYSASGEQATLTIEQPEDQDLNIGNYRYEWELLFNPDLPMALNIELGAGQGSIDLSQLQVTELDLNVGVGDVNLDLTGERPLTLEGSIAGGVGSLTVLLPAQVGARVSVSGGIGSIETSGLTETEDGYVNDAYSATDQSIILEIEGGVGEIDLQVVE